jgi:hypothetical protein
MMPRVCVLLLAAAFSPAIVRAQGAADAYVNEEARELVRLARLRRDAVDRRIEAYTTTARERMSVGLRAGIAEKLLFRRETVTDIAWERDGPVRLNVRAAREVVPPANARAHVPAALSDYVPHLAFDPFDSEMLLRFDTTSIRHPLSDGSEAHYRFQAGDTTVIRLPDGRSVRLRELRVLPRRHDPRLVNGSFWLDAATHAVVQAYFKLARPYDADLDPDSDVPGILKPLRADVDFFAIEYGLWELRWWLPRLLAVQGFVQVSRVRMPLAYERTYEAYTVRGDTAGPLIANDTTSRPCRPRVSFSIQVGTGDPPPDSVRRAREDSARAARAARRAEAGDTATVEECDREFFVTTAPDAVLLNSPELPPTAYEGDVELIPEEELRAIVERVRSLPGVPWSIRPPRLEWGWRGPGLVRYNRVEGLSLGARLLFDLGPATLATEGRIGLADREPRGEVAFERRGENVHTRAAAYRRLATATVSTNPHGTFASLGALLLGRDEAEFFDARGGEIVVRPPESRMQWYDVRLYAERQRPVERNTDFSIAHLIDSEQRFRENFTADAADQLGALLRLRAALGLDPASPQLAAELSLGGETGDYDIARPEALIRAGAPLLFGLHLGVEAAAGTVEGTAIPAQALWRLGGAATLRGYDGGSVVGERYWRTRAELARGVQAARVALFSDMAWAGSRNTFESDGALLSAGAGLSLLGGLVRLDLARALRSPTGWKLHFYFNGVL